MALCTQLQLEQIGQVDITAEPDAAVTYYRDVATAMIVNYCQRNLEYAAGNAETFDGGEYSVQVERWPIATLTSVVENGITLTSGTDYQADLATGIITRTGGAGRYRKRFRNYLRTVVVTYDGGYGSPGPAVPDALSHVCARIAGRIFRAGAAWAAAPSGASGSITSIALDDVGTLSYAAPITTADGRADGISMSDSAYLLEDEKRALDQYRNRSFV